MIGRINVAFGFLFLVATAALGPLMVNSSGDIAKASAEKRELMGTLQLARDSQFEDAETLEEMSPGAIAKLSARGVLALNKEQNARAPNESIKSGPHAHGNLEAMLNILVGLTLMFLAVPRWLKWAICLIFVAGTLLHSGVLYLVVVFQLPWALTLLQTGIGPVLILAGLALVGIAAAVGLRPELARD